MDFVYPLAGAFTGFIVGLTGVGGGALMTPILLLIFGVAPTTAIATDLWFATITKLAALIIHYREQKVEWPIVQRLWLGSLPAASLMVLALLSGFLTAISSKFLTGIIGFAILLTALGLFVKHWLTLNLNNIIANKEHVKRWQKPLTILGGAILGILVTLTSIGAGALGSVMLLYLYPVRLTPDKLVGTDIAHAIPLALLAGLGYLIAGHVNYHLLASLLLGSVPAALLGSAVATRFSHRKLRFCLVAILSISGLKLMLL
jgi:uncharacterized protein